MRLWVSVVQVARVHKMSAFGVISRDGIEYINPFKKIWLYGLSGLYFNRVQHTSLVKQQVNLISIAVAPEIGIGANTTVIIRFEHFHHYKILE